MAMAKVRTKKITHTAWCHLDEQTRERTLRQVLGPHFRDYMVADSLNKNFIFWDVIALKVRVSLDASVRLVVNSTCYIR